MVRQRKTELQKAISGRATRRASDSSSGGGESMKIKRDAFTKGAAVRVYEEMVDEAAASIEEDERPIKKRKTTAGRNKSNVVFEVHQTQGRDKPSPSDETEPDDWQDVGIVEDDSTSEDEESGIADRIVTKDISLVIGGPANIAKSSKKVSHSSLDKGKRIMLHKLHVSCLMAHAHIRNSWCNDSVVQTRLERHLDAHIRSYLNPDVHRPQFQRSEAFKKGLEMAGGIFRAGFKATARGLRRPQWAVDLTTRELIEPKDMDPKIDRHDFRFRAQDLTGSRDIGAQLFCAMLRSVGVDARLICSLQPLLFTTLPSNKRVELLRQGYDGTMDEDHLGDNDASPDTPTSQTSLPERSSAPRPIQRFGAATSQVRPIDLGRAAPIAVKAKNFHESKYPVYWVEAFNSAQQKWIPVDPLVTLTINKPKAFEPIKSDTSNDMSYVLAFNADLTVKDVTRRYAKAYNAKTRKNRVESTEGGEAWWARSFKLLKGNQSDRDQIEDAELVLKESQEPMPTSVDDFKKHPYYALDRYLRYDEVIHPKKEVGRLKLGKSDKIEPIYRRRDVQTVRSAVSWYRRFGRVIKATEQPLKHAAKRTPQRQRSPSAASDIQEDDQGIGLYAESQTDFYIPPTVIDGQVPKNDYGNLDIYAPSMIPPGAAHVRAPDAAKAAGILGIDFAEAVTGFEFKRSRAVSSGNPVLRGVVVAKEYAEAIEEVIRGLRWQEELNRQQKRSTAALKLWKKFNKGLHIREHIMSYETEGEKHANDIQARMDRDEDEEENAAEDGGFLPDRDQAAAQPTVEPQNKPTATVTDSVELDEDIAPETSTKWSLADYTEYHQITIYSPWDSPGPLHTHPNAPHLPKFPFHNPGAQNTQKHAAKPKDNGKKRKLPEVDDEGGGGGFLVSGDGIEVDKKQILRRGSQRSASFAVGSDGDEGSGASCYLPDLRGYGEVAHGGRVIEDKDKMYDDVFESDSEDDVVSPDGADGGRHFEEHGLDHPSSPSAAANNNGELFTESNLHGDVTQTQDQEMKDIASASVAVESANLRKADGGTMAAEDDNDDNGSLLSEDPEDADAEPEWLQ